MYSMKELCRELQADPSFMNQVSRWETIPAKPGVFNSIPENIHPKLKAGLLAAGIEQLYSHQARAYEEIQAGKDVVIVTPTASGKTLSFNLPVIETILTSPEARALYLFPTKALSQDQQATLNEISLGGDLGVKIATYDGDTPTSVRASARETGQIIISNPDMIHAGILPNHTKWIKFLKNLRFVVIDEVHMYRGVFGSHMTNVLRRLLRIARFYGSQPKIICCSATIGNPKELAEELCKRPMTLIDENGAPSGTKHLVFYNPPYVDRVQGIRRGTVTVAQQLASSILKKGFKTIVFARSRVRVELIASYIRQNLSNFNTDNGGVKVESYRGGYLPNERRTIEKGLRDGSIQGVVSTNALELGIDIGGLDVSIMAGFPGSVASVWQQSGRAGRRQTESLSILIASSAPLDQFMVENHDYFLGRSPERAFVNPGNDYILNDHLKCAVFELPMTEDDPFFSDVENHLQLLYDEGTIRFSKGKYYWSDLSYPSEGISLRSASSDNVVIVDMTAGKNMVIGEMDRPSAKELIFPQAIYIHRGIQYVVTDLDLENRRCYVLQKEHNYYTDTVVKRDIKVLLQDSSESLQGMQLNLCDILVRTQVTKFKKLRFKTHENIGYGEVNLPEEQMHTRALCIVFESGIMLELLEQLSAEGRTVILFYVATILKSVAPSYLLCDFRDIGVSERIQDPHFDNPSIYFYDQYPGGTGLAESLQFQLKPIIDAALKRIKQCGCDHGCPSCIGPYDSEKEIGTNPKPIVTKFLNLWREDLN